MKTKKRFLCIIIAIITLMSTATQISAIAADEVDDIEVISVSENTSTYMLSETIAVVESTKEVVYTSPARDASWTYKDYTHSKYYYIIETGERVTNYSLNASFRYDGESLAECRGTQTSGESLNSKWKIEGIATIDNASEHLGGAVGNFTLYKKNILGIWVENNTDEVRIWCDHEGNISTN